MEMKENDKQFNLLQERKYRHLFDDQQIYIDGIYTGTWTKAQWTNNIQSI